MRLCTQVPKERVACGDDGVAGGHNAGMGLQPMGLRGATARSASHESCPMNMYPLTQKHRSRKPHLWKVARSAMDPDRMVVEAAAKAQFQNQNCKAMAWWTRVGAWGGCATATCVFRRGVCWEAPRSASVRSPALASLCGWRSHIGVA